MKQVLSSFVLVGGLCGLFILLSHRDIHLKVPSESQVIFTFRETPQAKMICRKTTEEEKAKMLAHMRRDEICERPSAETLVRVSIDGKETFRNAYKALGLKADGISLGIEKWEISSGVHEVAIQVEQSGEGKTTEFRKSLDFKKGRAVLISFDSGKGYEVHEGGENEPSKLF